MSKEYKGLDKVLHDTFIAGWKQGMHKWKDYQEECFLMWLEGECEEELNKIGIINAAHKVQE